MPAQPEQQTTIGRRTLVAAVVGIDGSGKSSAYRGALARLATELDVAGIGDECLAGDPTAPLHARAHPPAPWWSRAAARAAKGNRPAWLYRQLKTIDLVGRSRACERVVNDERPGVLLLDGDPLVNTLAWSTGRLYRGQLQGHDGRILDALRYLSGQARIPRTELPYYLRHAWQLALVNRLGLARFPLPDVLVLLRIDGASAMERIRRRGRPLQAHETAEALDALGAGYERVCGLVEAHYQVRVLRIDVTHTEQPETARLVAEAVREAVADQPDTRSGDAAGPAIEVVATTISGSIRDQRKVGRIGPHFAATTRRPTRLHAVDSHAEARAVTHRLVGDGARLVVSAGGAGTFNAVLEGCHLGTGIPVDLRLAFLRKGSADLIGKMLGIPDELPEAVAAIVDAIESDRCLAADVIAVDIAGPRGETRTRHLIGFGGLGIFGAVPRFTEARWIKLYKGILGTIAGDYGPFFVGLALATASWWWQRQRGRDVPLLLDLDGEAVGPEHWLAVIVVGGDLGPDFPLGRGESFASGTFRVVGMRDRGLRMALRQLAAARKGALLDDPIGYGCLVRDVGELLVHPSAAERGAMATLGVNVDGLAETSHGAVRFRISGPVQLVDGHRERPGGEQIRAS